MKDFTECRLERQEGFSGGCLVKVVLHYKGDVCVDPSVPKWKIKDMLCYRVGQG